MPGATSGRVGCQRRCGRRVPEGRIPRFLRGEHALSRFGVCRRVPHSVKPLHGCTHDWVFLPDGGTPHYPFWMSSASHDRVGREREVCRPERLAANAAVGATNAPAVVATQLQEPLDNVVGDGWEEGGPSPYDEFLWNYD